MKKYRCPWCGKPTFTSIRRLSLSIPQIRETHLTTLMRPRCEFCNKQVDFDVNPIILIPAIIICLICGLFIILTDGNSAPSTIFVVVSLVSPIFLAIIYALLTVFVAPPIARRQAYQHSLRYRTLEPELHFDVEFDRKVSLRIENIFAIRVKEVDAEQINTHYDLVTEYKKDGAPVYIKKQNVGYGMGLLYPKNYDFKFFQVGTEFDVYDTEGEIIATGKIFKVLD